MQETSKIWMNGELVDWADATVHVGTHGLHYGSGVFEGIRAKISSWQRIGANVIPHVAKATGVYLNSMLAVLEANNAGYDEAILLTPEGFVADGSGENIFIVRDGVMYTPDLATGILPGITRDTIKQIAQDLGYTVIEKSVIRSDLSGG